MPDPYQEYRYPLTKQKYKLSAGATNEELIFDAVPTGHMWVVNWLAVIDEDHAVSALRVYIGGMGKEHWLLQHDTLTANVVYWTDTAIYIPEEKYLVVRFTGTTGADDLYAYISGFDVYQPARR